MDSAGGIQWVELNRQILVGGIQQEDFSGWTPMGRFQWVHGIEWAEFMHCVDIVRTVCGI